MARLELLAMAPKGGTTEDADVTLDHGDDGGVDGDDDDGEPANCLEREDVGQKPRTARGADASRPRRTAMITTLAAVNVGLRPIVLFCFLLFVVCPALTTGVIRVLLMATKRLALRR